MTWQLISDAFLTECMLDYTVQAADWKIAYCASTDSLMARDVASCLPLPFYTYPVLPFRDYLWFTNSYIWSVDSISPHFITHSSTTMSLTQVSSLVRLSIQTLKTVHTPWTNIVF